MGVDLKRRKKEREEGKRKGTFELNLKKLLDFK